MNEKSQIEEAPRALCGVRGCLEISNRKPTSPRDFCKRHEILGKFKASSPTLLVGRGQDQ